MAGLLGKKPEDMVGMAREETRAPSAKPLPEPRSMAGMGADPAKAVTGAITRATTDAIAPTAGKPGGRSLPGVSGRPSGLLREDSPLMKQARAQGINANADLPAEERAEQLKQARQAFDMSNSILQQIMGIEFTRPVYTPRETAEAA